MKKLAILLIVAASALLPAKAQFRYGPTAGVDVTSLRFSQHLFGVDQSVGEQLGVQCELMFPGIGFGVDFGLLYAQRGATLHLGEQKVWATDGFESPRSYLHYIEIPINLRFKWTRMNGLEERIAPFVFGGPTVSFLAGHNRIGALEYSGGDLGLQAGLGAEIMRHWQLQASYCWGMTYAIRTVKLNDLIARNRTWSIRLTYMF